MKQGRESQRTENAQRKKKVIREHKYVRQTPHSFLCSLNDASVSESGENWRKNDFPKLRIFT